VRSRSGRSHDPRPGASQATTDATRHGELIAQELSAADVDPTQVYDIEGLTLHEMPEAVCTIVRTAAASVDSASAAEQKELDAGHDARVGAAAAQTPDSALFHYLLSGATAAYGMRDDNGPLTWEWPAGLMRRAYLAAGGLLAADERMSSADRVFEMDVPDMVAALRGSSAPTADELDARAAHREWEGTQDGPDALGAPIGAAPDLSPFPPGLARMIGIVLCVTTMLEPDPDRTEEALSGLGIGRASYTGTARVADDPAELLMAMEPGHVLVTPWTAPPFNAVLSIAGAVVVQEGGLLCHAAVMARELDIRAVVGCQKAMTEIKPGDRIEVDPIAGMVRVVEAAAT
jgi:phosphohistidine swiveling domain-containing protein